MTSIALSAYRAPQLRLPRLLAGVSYYHPTGLAEHEQLYGPLPLPMVSPDQGRTWQQRPERLIEMVERSGLTGRGGAGFPTGRKMRSVAAGQGRAIVIANGAEGEPASCKDRLLLTRVRIWSWTGSRWPRTRSGPTRPTWSYTGRKPS